eukprot:TRINITY_DN4223_c0_g1_i1.p1 TRINITY_DN4223_c0_g1~~TRINITY_DN4223_c0_g1_i1.p1  ORF type:complete len:227 (-),score=32.94 TRINITY_DN4223_c0_g1_i1:68-748(-)
MQPAWLLPTFCTYRKTNTQIFLEDCERGEYKNIQHLFHYVKTEVLFEGIRIACEKGHQELLKFFLRLNVTNPVQDEETCWMGWTLLHRACEKGQLAIAQSLITHGWSLSTLNLNIQTPLDVATPFVLMSLNLDRHFRKALNFKCASTTENSVVTSLPQELVTSIIRLLLSDTDHEVKQNLTENELEEQLVPPRIKEQSLLRERDNDDTDDYAHNIVLKWFSVPVDF